MDFADFSICVQFCKKRLLNMLSHLTAYNFHFQLNIKNMSAVLGWSSSSNLALVVLGSIRKIEN